VANDHQTLHHVSCSLSKIPYGGFSPVRLQGRSIRRRLPAQCGTRSLHSSFVLSAAINSTSVLSRSRLLGEAPPFKRPSSLYPRGPRSGAGYSVPHPHHLIGLIRPTCRHIEISPHSGLYPVPSLDNCIQAHKWFRAFAARSFSTCRPRGPRRVHRWCSPSTTSPMTLAFAIEGAARHSQHSPPSASSGAEDVGASLRFAFATAYRVASLLGGSDRVSPATETFTSGLSTGRSPFPLPDITTVASGHSPPAGLSPAGTAASVAASLPDRYYLRDTLFFH
jgi:hypothetical protein